MTISKPQPIPKKFLARQSGMTTHQLGECITNLALNKPCIYLLHNTNSFHYVMNLARKIANGRGFIEAREKMGHKFALKNGGAELTFMSLHDENILSVNDGLAVRASNKPLFIDHFVWECRMDWPRHLRHPSFYMEPYFGKLNI